MTTTIETIFEKGVFRPLTPVAIPENRHVTISLDETELNGRLPATVDALPVGQYPLEELADEFDDRSVLLTEVGKKQVRFVHVGEIAPRPYPEE